MNKLPVNVGRLLCQKFRIMLDVMDIKYTEHRGLFISTFVLSVSDEQIPIIRDWIKKFNSTH